ncbi:MAG TPA: nucleotidyltransferase family protein [Novosphingobium sp.]|nr:nucleotidyltransferase family protein [Novosphingobium sp.]
MDRCALQHILLDLVGTAGLRPLDQPGQAAWAQIDAMAVQHRLQPLLHAQCGDLPDLPPDIRANWRSAYRVAAITALAQRAELVETVGLLKAHGIETIALKGAWLARHAYPDPALRPCRDLDLLVEAGMASAAFETLTGAGYALAEPPELSLEDTLRVDKHLPPLASPRGTCIELHHRLWEPDGRLDHASPLADLAGLRARAWRDEDGIAYPAGADMLGHLIVHAVYSHRFDCGPLLLADVDFLLRREAIDWPAFWARATAEGWRSGARLVLELVARYRPEAPIELDAGPAAPARLLDNAPGLLLQDLDTRKSAAVLAATLKAGPVGLTRRAKGERAATDIRPVRRDMAGEGGYLGWVWSRLVRTVGDLVHADVRRQSRDLAQLSRWLDS